MNEWLDESGFYPTDAALERIEQWPYTDVAGCLDFARSLWHWPEFAEGALSEAERETVHAEPDEEFVRFATGGWSGNEAIIAALKVNQMLRSICWVLSTRGGLHIFRYPPTE